MAEPMMCKSLLRSDPLFGIQVRHLYYEISEIRVNVAPCSEWFQAVLQEVFGEAHNLRIEGIAFADMVKEAKEACLVTKVRYMPREYMSPRVIRL